MKANKIYLHKLKNNDFVDRFEYDLKEFVDSPLFKPFDFSEDDVKCECECEYYELENEYGLKHRIKTRECYNCQSKKINMEDINSFNADKAREIINDVVSDEVANVFRLIIEASKQKKNSVIIHSRLDNTVVSKLNERGFHVSLSSIGKPTIESTRYIISWVG